MKETLEVCAVTPEAVDKAQRLATQLELPFAYDTHHSAVSLLVSSDDIRYQHPSFEIPFRVDFLSGTVAARISLGLNKRDPLAKALAISPHQSNHIFDGTAGFGRDAMLIARYGQKITMIEKHPVIHALLADGINRAFAQENFCKLIPYQPELIHSEAQQYALIGHKPVEVIYLDPMYPKRKKQLKVKKESQVLQLLTEGRENEYEQVELLEWACSLATKRVVVKRPRWAEPLTDLSPTTAIYNQNTRYDIYIV